MKIPTAHINCEDESKVAKLVLMPGDPLRAKYIAETYLEDVEQFNTVRNMFGYTGTYKGKKVSVMGSGMGMPSIGIYSYELFAFYGVEKILRIGTAGSYSEDYNVYDVVLADSVYSESTFASAMLGEFDQEIIAPSKSFNEEILKSADELGKTLKKGCIHSSDVFYRKQRDLETLRDVHNCVAVEMEAYALFTNAAYLNKQAACILTISDSLVTGEATTSEEREKKLHNMIEIALNTL